MDIFYSLIGGTYQRENEFCYGGFGGGLCDDDEILESSYSYVSPLNL